MPESRNVFDNEITLDKSGELLNGVFYRVSIWGAFFPDSIAKRLRRDAVFLESALGCKESTARIDGFTYKEVHDDRYLCENGKDHAVQRFYVNVAGERVNNGVFQEFVKDDCADKLFVSVGLGRRIESTRLKGFRLTPVSVVDHISGENVDGVLHLQCAGRNCQRPLRINSARNICPYCKSHWIICQDCAKVWSRCVKYDKWTTRSVNDNTLESELALTLEDAEFADDILEGSKWDGSDFVATHHSEYFSKRVIAWLQRIHAGPLSAVPVKMCVDGMSAEQLEWLNASQEVSAVEL